MTIREHGTGESLLPGQRSRWDDSEKWNMCAKSAKTGSIRTLADRSGSKAQ